MTEAQIESAGGIEVGPVDVVVIEFADAKFSGEGLPILLDLVAKGTIRIIDAVVIKANEDGSFVSLSVEDLDATGGAWDLVSGWSSDVLGQDDFDRSARSWRRAQPRPSSCTRTPGQRLSPPPCSGRVGRSSPSTGSPSQTSSPHLRQPKTAEIES